MEVVWICFLIGGDWDEYVNSGFDGVKVFDNFFLSVMM